MRKRELLVERSQHYLVKTQLRRIAATLKPLRQGVNMDDVLEKIVVAILKFTEEDEAQFGFSVIESDEESITLSRGKRYKSKGRPRKVAKHDLIAILTAVYKNATGRSIGRSVQNVVPKQGRGEWDHSENAHPFLAACMKAASTSYSRRITRDVLRPTKMPTSS
jgi:hypothetical protein